MNDWGLPDWRDPSSYGDTDKWDWFRWRWEFYRRRPDLRQAFDERAENSYQLAIRTAQQLGRPVENILKTYEPGFVAESYLEDDFGYHGIPNPRISDQPFLVLQSVEAPPGSLTVAWPMQKNQIGHGAEPLRIPVQSESEFAIVFDLSKPLEDQLKNAKKTLDGRQKDLFGKKIQTRKHQSKWLMYLQVLDGREAGETWAELASVLQNTSRTEQNARDTHEQASYLCFNF